MIQNTKSNSFLLLELEFGWKFNFVLMKNANRCMKTRENMLNFQKLKTKHEMVTAWDLNGYQIGPTNKVSSVQFIDRITFPSSIHLTLSGELLNLAY